jgi:uroporphyrinogen-III synthase
VAEQVVESFGESEPRAQEAVTPLIRIAITGAGTLTTVMEYGGRVRVVPPERDWEVLVMATSSLSSLVAVMDEPVRVLIVAVPTGALRPAKFTGRGLVRLKLKRMTLSVVPSVYAKLWM